MAVNHQYWLQDNNILKTMLLDSNPIINVVLKDVLESNFFLNKSKV